MLRDVDAAAAAATRMLPLYAAAMPARDYAAEARCHDAAATCATLR